MKTIFSFQKRVFILFLLSCNLLIAQDKIQLIHQSSQEVISFAHFHYGAAHGISDVEGFITIAYQEKQSLSLSHVEYGKLSFSDEEVQGALSSGVLVVQKIGQNYLQPVTVLGIQSNTNEKQALTLEYQDKLAHDAGAFLNQTPEINAIRKSGSYGFDPVLRGFKYDQLNIVMDGAQCANAACPNRMDPPVSQVPLHQMESVEVLKGPYILRFGNVLGGTVNFVSVKPTFSTQFEPILRVSSAYESNGSIFRNEVLTGFKNQFLEWDVNATWSEGLDYQDGDGSTVSSAFSRGSFGTRLALKISDNQSIELKGSYNRARDVDFPALAMDLRKDDTWLWNAKHFWKPTNYFSLNTQIYFTKVNHLMDNLGKNLNPRNVNARTDAETQNWGGRTEAKVLWNKSFAYFGVDFRRQEAEGIRRREMLMGMMAGRILEDNAWQNGRIDQLGIFAEYHILKEKNEFIFSTRIEQNQANVLNASPEFTENYEQLDKVAYNPSMSVGWIHNFSDSFSASWWVGRSQRSASLAERYINYFPIGLDPFEMLGNPNLAPEVNNQSDLNLTFQKSGTAITLNGFVAYLQDYITSEKRLDLETRLPTSPGVRQFINVDEALLTGFEFSLHQKLPMNLQANFALAYTYGENLVTTEALPEIAPLDMRFNLSGSFIENKLSTELTWRHVETQNRFAESFGENRTSGFNLVDLRVSYQFWEKLQLTAGVQNLFDALYFEHLTRSVRGTNDAIFAPGRNFYVTCSFSF